MLGPGGSLAFLPRRRVCLVARVGGGGAEAREVTGSIGAITHWRWSSSLASSHHDSKQPPLQPVVPIIPFSAKQGGAGRVQRRREGDGYFRVLSLDGGGFRGLITARLIERIEEKAPGFLSSVDLVAGTSGGGILALLLGAGYQPDACQRLCRHAAEHVFRSSWIRAINPFISRYSGKEKERFLREYLGERRLADMDKYVLVTAVNLLQCVKVGRGAHHNRSWRPAIFSNLPQGPAPATTVERGSRGGNDDGDDHDARELLAYQAAMRTSAAPTFFPIHQGYCDGGLISSDPSLIAFGKVRAHFPDIPPDRIKVLSLGAGSLESFLDRGGPEKLEWGLAQWSTRIIRLLLHSGAVTSKSLMEDMMGPRSYHRLDPVMRHDPIPFDACHRVGELIDMAEETDLTDTVEFVRKDWGLDSSMTSTSKQEVVVVAGALQQHDGHDDGRLARQVNVVPAPGGSSRGAGRGVGERLRRRRRGEEEEGGGGGSSRWTPVGLEAAA